MITQMAHACIYAPDLTAAQKYYCEALGIEKRFDFVRNDAPFGFYLHLGHNTFIEVFRGEGQTKEGVIRHLCLEVQDIESVRRRLLDAGYEATEKKLGADQSWQFWSTDPGGVRLEFHEYTPQSSQNTGATVIANW